MSHPASTMREMLETPRPPSFASLEEDDRLRLFAWATADNNRLHLAVLRVFDRAHEAYTVQLRVGDVRAALGTPAAHPESSQERSRLPDDESLLRTLDYLTECGVLQRSQDTARVTSIAEYRRRRPVYQFTELGYRAFRNVDDVLRARPGEGQLQRFAFGAICDDLHALATANDEGDTIKVHRYLRQLDSVFTEMTDKAGQFFVMIGQLAQQHEARPEVFLDFKDRLLAYLQDFLTELQRYRPLIGTAIDSVEATGVDRLVARATEADESPFLTPVERETRWRSRWDGLVRWFAGAAGQAPTVDVLDRTTATAIGDLSSLLRRVTESRHRGISRASELTFLARWFAATEADDDAHALFAATFALAPARHLALPADIEEDGRIESWWEAEPVEVSGTLRRRGAPPSPGRPAPVPDDTAAKHRARALQEGRLAARDAAARSLAERGVTGRTLGPEELSLLLDLLARALRARRSPTSSPDGEAASEVRHGSLRLTLRPSRQDTVVTTCRGILTLRRLDLDVAPSSASGSTSPGAPPVRASAATGRSAP